MLLDHFQYAIQPTKINGHEYIFKKTRIILRPHKSFESWWTDQTITIFFFIFAWKYNQKIMVWTIGCIPANRNLQCVRVCWPKNGYFDNFGPICQVNWQNFNFLIRSSNPPCLFTYMCMILLEKSASSNFVNFPGNPSRYGQFKASQKLVCEFARR